MGKREKIEGSNSKKIKIIKYVIMGIFAIVLIATLIYFGVKAYGDYKEKKSYNDLADYMNDIDQEVVTTPEKTAKMVKLEELHNQYEDVVAWIDIPGTNITYPVVQANDNSYYLDHTYQKEYSARGSIFLDMDASITKPSDNFLIYGHRNKNGAMFEDMMKYKSEDFYKEHKTINFVTLLEDKEYEILAVFESRIYRKSDKNVYRYYYFVNSDDTSKYNSAITDPKAAYDDFVSNAKKSQLYETGVTAEYGDQLLTLSTCAYHTDNGRFVIVAKKKA